MIYFLVFFICLVSLCKNSLLVNYFVSFCSYCGFPVIPGLKCSREQCPENKKTNASPINSHNKFHSAVTLFLPYNHINATNATSATSLFYAHQKRFYGEAASIRKVMTSGKQKANALPNLHVKFTKPAKQPDLQVDLQKKTTKQNKSKFAEQSISNKTLPFNKPLVPFDEKTTLASKSIEANNTQALHILASPIEPSKIVGQSKHFPPAYKE